MCLDPYKNWIQVDPIFEFLKLLLCCDVALSSPIYGRLSTCTCIFFFFFFFFFFDFLNFFRFFCESFNNCQASYTGKINTITSATSTAPAEKRAKNGCEDSRESKKLMAVKTVELHVSSSTVTVLRGILWLRFAHTVIMQILLHNHSH